MARPDLPKGYGGWQAIDATPQETSDGKTHLVKGSGDGVDLHYTRSRTLFATSNMKIISITWSIYKLISYLRENILRLDYKDQSVNSVDGNKIYLLRLQGTE
jgi:hypothetical protein